MRKLLGTHFLKITDFVRLNGGIHNIKTTRTHTIHMSPRYIYLHVTCINNWITIVDTILHLIHNSGLYDRVEEIRCVILGESPSVFTERFRDDKLRVIYSSQDTTLYEFKIMELLLADSAEADFEFLYLHSKGVSHNGQNECVTDWTNYMLYFTVMRHVECLEQLEMCDVVGVNLQDKPVLHYSGNFWWSKASHIRKLGAITDMSYHGPEFYVTTGANSRYCGLWLTNIDHYCYRYVTQNYVGTPSRVYYVNT